MGVGVGSTPIPFEEVVKALFGKAADESVRMIILDIRLPRVMLAGMVGASLAAAGAAYQGLFQNPLADPYLLGVAQGAGLGAVLGFLLPVQVHFGSFGTVPLFAFLGGMGAVGAVFLIARVRGLLPTTVLILAGVAVGSFLSAITSFFLLRCGEELHGVLFWLLGGFSGARWEEVAGAAPYILAGALVLMAASQKLNVLQLGEEQALELGVDVEKIKRILLFAATLMTAAAVSFSGIIGFVGIIVPHALRLIWGSDYRLLLPLSLLSGAIFLILADLGARTLLSPGELPVGVVTAVCGVPFFLYLLRTRKKMLL